MVLCSKRFIATLVASLSEEVVIRGWILHLRELARTTFIVVKDCSGEVQCVVASELVRELKLKLDEPVEVRGKIKPDKRAKLGFEVEVVEINVLNRVSVLPFNSSSDISDIGIETILAYRPLSLRHSDIGDIFRIQAAIITILSAILRRQIFHRNSHI